MNLPSIDWTKTLDSRENVTYFESLMKKEPQVELQVKHHFSKGVYARELFIPKGVILCGHIHKYENLNIVSKGVIDVLIDNEITRIEAPFTIVSPAGTKRIAKAVEDTIWTTIHGTDEIDVDRIEKYFIAHSEQEFREFLAEQEHQLSLELCIEKALSMEDNNA